MHSLRIGRSVVITFLVFALVLAETGWTAPFRQENFPSLTELKSLKALLGLPERLAAIDHFNMGKGPLVIHIQNAHGHYPIQKNIFLTLHYLKTHLKIKTIYIEGSAFPLDENLLRFFPDDKKINWEIAEILARNGLVKGVELFLLQAPEIHAYGIENLRAYRSNLKNLKFLLTHRDTAVDLRAALNDFSQDLNNKLYFSEKLRSFLKRFDESRFLSWEGHLDDIKEKARQELGVDLSDIREQAEWPMLVRYFKSTELKRLFDVDSFHTEHEKWLRIARTRMAGMRNHKFFLEIFRAGRPLSNPILSGLFEHLMETRPSAGGLRPGTDIAPFIGSQVLLSEIKGERLLNELLRLRDHIAKHIADTQTERRMLVLLSDLRLLQRLFMLELTSGEFRQVIDRQNHLRPKKIFKRLTALLSDSKRLFKLERVMNETEMLFDRTIAFYQQARDRDPWMIKNMETQRKAKGESASVIITGGFHASALQKYFEKHNRAFVSLAPKSLPAPERKGTENYHRSILQNTAIPGPSFFNASYSLESDFLTDPYRYAYGVRRDWEGRMVTAAAKPVLSKYFKKHEQQRHLKQIYFQVAGPRSSLPRDVAPQARFERRIQKDAEPGTREKKPDAHQIPDLQDSPADESHLSSLRDFLKSNTGEFTFVVGIALFTGFVSALLNFHDRTLAWIEPYGDHLIGAVFHGMVALAVGLSVYSYRRWHGAYQEIKLRKQAEEDLASLANLMTFRADLIATFDRSKELDEMLENAQQSIKKYFQASMTHIWLANDQHMVELRGDHPSPLFNKIAVQVSGPESLVVRADHLVQQVRKQEIGHRPLHSNEQLHVVPFIAENQILGAFAMRGKALNNLLTDGLSSVMRDIALAIKQKMAEESLKQAKKILQQNEKHFRQALQAARTGTWEWDLGTNRIQWSQNIESIFGRPLHSFTGTYEEYIDLIYPEDREEVVDAMAEILQGERKVFYLEHRVKRLSHGAIRWLATKGELVESGGKRKLMTGVVIDITELKETQEKLSKSYEDLREAHEKLKKTQNKLLEAERMAALGMIAAGVAHEIKNPLAASRGSTELALQEIAEIRSHYPEETASFEKIDQLLEQGSIQNIDRINEILRDLLDYSRPSSELFTLTDIHTPIQTALINIGRSKQNALQPIQVEEIYGKEIPKILGVNNELVQLFTNLIANAYDAMPAGGKLTVQTAVDDSGRFVEILIRDSGVGMDAKTVSRIFDVFFTTKTGDKWKNRGTGLGLPISEKIIKNHEGKMSVQSEIGKGTEFKITFPVPSAGAVEAALAKSGHQVSEEEGRSKMLLPKTQASLVPGLFKRSGKALVIDDEPFIRTLLATALGRFFEEVLLAEDMEGALQLVEERSDIDFFISDLALPGMHGDQGAEIIRSKRPTATIIILSGFDSAATRNRVEGLKAQGVIQEAFSKPFSVAMIQETVMKLKSQQRSEWRMSVKKDELVIRPEFVQWIKKVRQGIMPLRYEIRGRAFMKKWISRMAGEGDGRTRERSISEPPAGTAEPLKAMTFSPEYFSLLRFRMQSAAAVGGRVALAGDWVQRFLQDPEALYLLLQTLTAGKRGEQNQPPVMAFIAEKSESQDRMRLLVHAKDSRLGLGKRIAIQKFIRNIDQHVQFVGVQDLSGYVRQNNYGVVLLGTGQPAAFEIFGIQTFILNPADLGPFEKPALILLLPSLLKAAQLLHGISPKLHQKMLRPYLDWLFPGSRESGGDFILSFPQYLSEVVQKNQYLSTQA